MHVCLQRQQTDLNSISLLSTNYQQGSSKCNRDSIDVVIQLRKTAKVDTLAVGFETRLKTGSVMPVQ